MRACGPRHPFSASRSGHSSRGTREPAPTGAAAQRGFRASTSQRPGAASASTHHCAWDAACVLAGHGIRFLRPGPARSSRRNAGAGPTGAAAQRGSRASTSQRPGAASASTHHCARNAACVPAGHGIRFLRLVSPQQPSERGSRPDGDSSAARVQSVHVTAAGCSLRLHAPLRAQRGVRACGPRHPFSRPGQATAAGERGCRPDGGSSAARGAAGADRARGGRPRGADSSDSPCAARSRSRSRLRVRTCRGR